MTETDEQKRLQAERVQREQVQTWVALGCVASIGVGSWLLNPALGLIVPASILLAGVVYGRTR